MSPVVEVEVSPVVEVEVEVSVPVVEVEVSVPVVVEVSVPVVDVSLLVVVVVSSGSGLGFSLGSAPTEATEGTFAALSATSTCSALLGLAVEPRVRVFTTACAADREGCTEQHNCRRRERESRTTSAHVQPLLRSFLEPGLMQKICSESRLPDLTTLRRMKRPAANLAVTRMVIVVP